MKHFFTVLFLCHAALLFAKDIYVNGQGAAIVPAGMPVSAMPVKEGALQLPSGKYFYTRNIPAKLACAEYQALELEMCSSAPAEVLTGIYWRTVEEPKLAEARKAVLTVPLSTRWQKIILPLDMGQWQGNLLDFRLDFRVPAGITAQVRSIKFIKELPSEAFTEPLNIFPGTQIKGHTVGNFRQFPDKLTFTMSKSYGYTHIVPVNYAAKQGRYLKVVFKAVNASSIRIGAYFRTAKDPKLTDSKSTYKQLKATGELQSAILDLGSKTTYQGVITGIRFDFGAAAGAQIEVKSIQVVNDPTEALPLTWERGINISKSNCISTLATGKIYLVRPVPAGAAVKFFDVLGEPAGEVKLAADGAFHLSGRQALAQIVVPGSVPPVEVVDSGKYFTPWQAQWIAPAGCVRQGGRFIYRKEIDLTGEASCRIRLTADDGFILKINGQQVAGRMNDWRKIMDLECSKFLRQGRNVFEVEVINTGDWGGLLFHGGIVEKDGRKITLNSDKSWQITDHSGKNYEVAVIGVPPVGPWGKMAYQEVFEPWVKPVEAVKKVHRPLPGATARLHRTDNGVRVMVNGQTVFLCGFKTSYHAPEQHRMMADNGVADFQASSGTMRYHGSVDLARENKGTYDFTILDEKIRSVLEFDPQARLMISIGVDAPEYFSREFPGEVTTLHDGRNTMLSSPASEKLKKENESFIRAVVAHLEKSPYAGNITIYRAVSQCDGGEYQYYTTWRNREFDGYSPAMLKKFREFLRKKYGTSAALARAWQDETVTLENASVPLPAERTKSFYATFRDPVRDRRVLDFIDCQAQVMADWAIHTNKILRQCVPDKLIASYGGYTMFYQQPQMEKSGHLAFDRLLDSGSVDLYTPPQDYNMRPAGDPAGSMVPHASVRLRGQKIFSENDSRTHFGGSNGQCHSSSLFEDVGLLKRDFAFNLLTDSGTYFYDMTGSWFNDPELLGLIGSFNRIGRAAQRFNTASASEVAIFNDTASFKLISPQAVAFSAMVLRDVRRELNSAGAGIADEYYLNDILRDDFPADRYKVVIFPNIFQPPDEIRRAIEVKFKKRNTTLIFGYGAGMFYQGSVNAAGMKQLTGMDFTVDTGKKVNVNGIQVDPAVFPAEKLIRKEADFTVIYLPDPAVNRREWGKVLKNAGVHLLTDSGDPAGYNGRFLYIHAASAGKKVLTLPEKSHVYDLFRNKCIAENAAGFTVDMLRGETNIYFLGTPDEYQRFMEAE